MTPDPDRLRARLPVRRTRPARRLGRLGGVVALTVGLVAPAACGVTRDQAARPIDEPLFGLLDATTTTTTEPPPPPTTVPPTSAPPVPEPTTTTLPTENVSLYFATGDRIRRSLRAVPRPPGSGRLAPLEVFAQLQTPPADAGVANLATADLVAEIAVDRGRAVVMLTPAFFALPPPPQLAAAAQLTLTLTDRPGIGRVLFVDATNQPQQVPRADGSTAEDVAAEDYLPLLVP